LGCGRGNDCLELEKISEDIIGIDISSKALKEAKTNYIKHNFLQADAEQLPFKNSSFDVVYCKSILHHLNLDKSLIEITRILKLNGILFIAYEPGLLNPFGFIGRKFFPSNVHTPNEHPFIPYKFKKKILSMGYEQIYFEYYYLYSIIIPIIFKKIAHRSMVKFLINISLKIEDLIKITPLNNFYLSLAGVFLKMEQIENNDILLK
jgi:ubiquinone/menaquinone biosynthesis C-methylase UbiE